MQAARFDRITLRRSVHRHRMSGDRQRGCALRRRATATARSRPRAFPPRSPPSEKPSDLPDIARRLPFMHDTTRFQVGRMIDLHFRRLRLDVSRTWPFEAPEACSPWSPPAMAGPSPPPRRSSAWPRPRPNPRCPAPPSAVASLLSPAPRNSAISPQLAALFRQRLRQDHAPRHRRPAAQSSRQLHGHRRPVGLSQRARAAPVCRHHQFVTNVPTYLLPLARANATSRRMGVMLPLVSSR